MYPIVRGYMSKKVLAEFIMIQICRGCYKIQGFNCWPLSILGKLDRFEGKILKNEKGNSLNQGLNV